MDMTAISDDRRHNRQRDMLFALHTHPGISGPKIRRNDPEHAEMPLFVGDPGSLIWVLRKKADFCAIGLISARCSSQNTPKTPPFPTCSCSETTTKCDGCTTKPPPPSEHKTQIPSKNPPSEPTHHTKAGDGWRSTLGLSSHRIKSELCLFLRTGRVSSPHTERLSTHHAARETAGTHPRLGEHGRCERFAGAGQLHSATSHLHWE